MLTWKEVNEPKFDDDQCYAALAVKYRCGLLVCGLLVCSTSCARVRACRCPCACLHPMPKPGTLNHEP